jgi:5-methylcytosine-specific restriction endonuclease McrA
MAQRLRAEGRVCHLCGLPIDPELQAPHPLSFSLDHLVPLALGGARDDPSNVAPAHRLCNMKRGTGRGNARSARANGQGPSALW